MAERLPQQITGGIPCTCGGPDLPSTRKQPCPRFLESARQSARYLFESCRKNGLGVRDSFDQVTSHIRGAAEAARYRCYKTGTTNYPIVIPPTSKAISKW